MPAVVDTLRLTAEDAIGLVERGELSPAELHAAYLEAIAERNASCTRTYARSTRRRERACRSRSRT